MRVRYIAFIKYYLTRPYRADEIHSEPHWYRRVLFFTNAGEAESRQRAIEESRPFDSHPKYAARGVRRHGRFFGVSLERRERRTSKAELLVTPERRISPVRRRAARRNDRRRLG